MRESQLVTLAEFEALAWDGNRRELLDGELIVSPAPSVRHQRLVLRLTFAFEQHIREHGGGEVFGFPADVVLSNSNVVEPDAFFISSERSSIVTERNIEGVPSLIIEVLSDPRRDRVRKRDLYARFAVPEYWIVDPDADRVEVHTLEGERYSKPAIFEPGESLTYHELPGLSIDLNELFAR